MINHRKHLELMVRMTLVFLFISACGIITPSPTPLPPTPQPIPPSATLTPIPPTSTFTPIPPTATLPATATVAPSNTTAPLPSDTAVSPVTTSSGERIGGGEIIAKGKTQIIVFGQYGGSGGDAVHVVEALSFKEVASQKAIQMVLSGGGPPLFAFMGEQPFKNDKGVVAKAKVSVGSSEDPNVSIGVLWTGEIGGIFPNSTPLSAQKDQFSVQKGAAVEYEGWLELGQIWTSDKTLQSGNQREGFAFLLFHHDKDTYMLGFLPDYQTVVPAEDKKAAGISANTGQEHVYMIKGSISGEVRVPQEAMMPIPLPILQVNSIERKK